MKLARKEGKMWHFAEPEHCGWAQTYTDEDAFDETTEVDSPEEVGEFCSMCSERRK